jgi:hypothetical protein
MVVGVFKLKCAENGGVNTGGGWNLFDVLSNHVLRQFFQCDLSATWLAALEVRLKLFADSWGKRSIYCIASMLLDFVTIQTTTS